jgi:hypothetical protein
LLIVKFIVALGSLPLGVDLSGAGLRLLLLLVGLLLIKGELHSWLRYCGSHVTVGMGLEGWSVLWGWHSGDGVSRGHHVAPSGPGDPELPYAPQAAPPLSEDS